MDGFEQRKSEDSDYSGLGFRDIVRDPQTTEELQAEIFRIVGSVFDADQNGNGLGLNMAGKPFQELRWTYRDGAANDELMIVLRRYWSKSQLVDDYKVPEYKVIIGDYEKFEANGKDNTTYVLRSDDVYSTRIIDESGDNNLIYICSGDENKIKNHYEWLLKYLQVGRKYNTLPPLRHDRNIFTIDGDLEFAQVVLGNAIDSQGSTLEKIMHLDGRKRLMKAQKLARSIVKPPSFLVEFIKSDEALLRGSHMWRLDQDALAQAALARAASGKQRMPYDKKRDIVS